jgi:type IV secretion system protein VirB6
MTAYISDIFTSIDSASTVYVAATAAHIAAVLQPIFTQMFTLFVLMWGFAMYRGVIEEPIMDGVFRLMKIAIVGSLSIGVLSTSAMITTDILALPDYATTLFGNTTGSTGATTAAGVLDDAATQIVAATSTLWNTVSVGVVPPTFTIMPLFYGLLVLIVGTILVLYAAFLIALSKIAIGVLVAAAPLFMISLMFDGTKKFFEAWVGQVVTYALTSGLAIGMVMMLVKGLFVPTATAVALAVSQDTNIGLANLLTFIIEGVIFFLVLMQVQSIASGLGGGAALTTMGAVRGLTSRAAGVAKHYGSRARGERALQANRLANMVEHKNKSSSPMAAAMRTAQFTPVSTLAMRGVDRLRGKNSIAKG